MKIEKMAKINLSYSGDIYWLRFNGENHREIIEALGIDVLNVGTILEKDKMTLVNEEVYINLKIDDILIYFGGKALHVIDIQEFNAINFFLKQLEKTKGE